MKETVVYATFKLSSANAFNLDQAKFFVVLYTVNLW